MSALSNYRKQIGHNWRQSSSGGKASTVIMLLVIVAVIVAALVLSGHPLHSGTGSDTPAPVRSAPKVPAVTGWGGSALIPAG